MPHNESNLIYTDIAMGMSIYITASLTDQENHDIVYLDICGARGACRATMAVFNSRQISNWQLSDHPVRLQKLPGHAQMINELPNGMVNYTWINFQALPQRLLPGLPSYVWYMPNEKRDSDNSPPANFYNVFQASMSFPSKPEWASILWNRGIDRKLINPISRRNSNGLTGFKIKTNDTLWEHVIKDAFLSNDIQLVPGHRVYREVPTSEQLTESIEWKRFELGEIVITPDVSHIIREHNVNVEELLHRHAKGDYGITDYRDINKNNRAIMNGDDNIMSTYKAAFIPGTKEPITINIMTEANRQLTTIFTPMEA
jgi:hypothetical protein